MNIRKNLNIIFALIILTFRNSLLFATPPVIDGRLDDVVWEVARQISDLKVTSPYSLNEPTSETIIKYYSDEAGLYFGFLNRQPENDRVTSTTLRDAPIRSDYNEVIIDFDASGDRAFGFKVSRQNSIQDSVWTNENEENIDWDGSWEHAVVEADDYWSSEFFIPWDVTVSQLTEQQRKVGLYFSRWNEGLRQQYSYPPIYPSQQLFLEEFEVLTFEAADSSGLDIFPYVRVDQDLLNDQSNYDAGIDIFWKPTSNRQFNITINPDFGQVESNELVVNFSAIETFFSEKRPFFSENNELFDLQGPENLRVIHTPNIGGEPDGGFSGNDGSDILAAARFTQIGENIDFAVLTALENDTENSIGRDYATARIQYRLDEGKVGFLHSLVDRPSLDRKAQSSSFDFQYNFSEEYRVSGQAIRSIISLGQRSEISDVGWWLTNEWQPENSISHELTIFSYGKDLDISDFGFVRRVNREQLEYEFQKEWNEVNVPNIRDTTFSFGMEYGVNKQNISLPRQVEFGLGIVTDNAAQWEFDLEYRTAGIDDLFTRGANLLKLPRAFATGVSYESIREGRFSWAASLDFGEDGLEKPFYELSVEPQWQITDQVNVALQLDYIESQSWLVFLEDNDLGDFERKELSATLNLSAQLGERHQLSLKMESVALEANVGKSYTADVRGNLFTNNTSVSDFSLSEFAFQARYRYELGPLSELFLVYSRGGEFERNDLRSDFFDLIRNSINQPNAERLLFKIRRQF